LKALGGRREGAGCVLIYRSHSEEEEEGEKMATLLLQTWWRGFRLADTFTIIGL